MTTMPTFADQRLDILLAAHRRGEVSAETLCQGVYAYLQERCPGCRTSTRSNGVTMLDALSDEVIAELESLRLLVEGGDREAAFSLVVKGGTDRFSSSELAAALTVKCREALPGDPTLSGRWADVAGAVAGKGTSDGHRERLALALAYRGNAVRAGQVQGLGSAEAWLNAAWILLSLTPAASDEVIADILRLAGTLAKDQRRFDESARLLNKSLALYLALGDDQRVSRSLLGLAQLHFVTGEVEGAICLVRSAHAWARQANSNSLRLNAALNLAIYSEFGNDLMTAQNALMRTAELREKVGGDFLSCRFAWIEAMVDTRRGCGEAVNVLWDLYREQIERGAAYDAVALLLDLARLAQLRGEEPELSRIAVAIDQLREAAPEHHYEARTALGLLRQSVLNARLTRSTILAFFRYFSRLHLEPNRRLTDLDEPSS